LLNPSLENRDFDKLNADFDPDSKSSCAFTRSNGDGYLDIPKTRHDHKIIPIVYLGL